MHLYIVHILRMYTHMLPSSKYCMIAGWWSTVTEICNYFFNKCRCVGWYI